MPSTGTRVAPVCSTSGALDEARLELDVAEVVLDGEDVVADGAPLEAQAAADRRDDVGAADVGEHARALRDAQAHDVRVRVDEARDGCLDAARLPLASALSSGA